jgi:hypothetical protein
MTGITGNYNLTKIAYNGVDLGPIYLKDIGQRNQLGGGKGIYVIGQDQYIDHGADATLISTSDVMMSCTSGTIHHFATDASAFTVVITAD